MSIDIRREAEELVRYYGELGRRISQKGVRDVADLLSLYDQLRRALDAVSRQEIGWAVEQTERLVEHLVHMDANLQALRRLKGALSGLPPVEARPAEVPGSSPVGAARLP
jgi:hypothetical protein